MLFLLHASLYRGWLIDDAGISGAYAKNLAAGFGLVSQPGVEAVEGFSNPLWTMGLAVFELLGLFHPLQTPKLISALLVLGAFLALQRVLTGILVWRGNSAIFTFAVLTCCAANPSFVIWTTAGLENPLYVALICLSLVLCLNAAAGSASLRLACTAGGVAALIALTRPDGVVFLLVFPLAAGLGSEWWNRKNLQQLVAYLIPLTLIAGAYLSFRLTYFGEWLPNTYYAKPGSGASLDEGLLDNLRALTDLFANSAFPEGAWIAVLAYVGFPLLILARTGLVEKQSLIVVYLFLSAGFIAYRVLPHDWMGEYRFATALFPLAYVFVFVLAASLVAAWSPEIGVIARYLPASMVAVFLAASSGDFYFRAMRFSAAPTVPLDNVAAQYADRYNVYADRLGIDEASLAAPDIGGALMYSRLRIVDLAGLCDRRIGRLIHRDKAGLRAYVLDEVKPTFIHVHGPWARAFDFYADARFSEDYLVIDESLGAAKSGVRQILHGSYVRKDALGASGAERLVQLSQLKIERSRKLYPRLTHSSPRATPVASGVL